MATQRYNTPPHCYCAAGPGASVDGRATGDVGALASLLADEEKRKIREAAEAVEQERAAAARKVAEAAAAKRAAERQEARKREEAAAAELAKRPVEVRCVSNTYCSTVQPLHFVCAASLCFVCVVHLWWW